MELREFKCKECGHTVVAHPGIPPDVTPNICMECYSRGELAHQARMAILMLGMMGLLARLRPDVR
jgi:hypothetical protein